MRTLALVCMLASSLLGCGGSNDAMNPAPPAEVKTNVVTVPVVKIVTIGDSETAGAVSTPTGFVNIPEASYPARLQGLLGSRASVVNLGVNSSNLPEVYADQFSIARALNPDILIVSTTLNDAGDFVDKDLLYSLWGVFKRDLPNTRIILLTPLKPHTSITNLTEYSANLYRANALGIEVFDIGAHDTPDWYCGNTDFHPCEYGYREMARYVARYLGE